MAVFPNAAGRGSLWICRAQSELFLDLMLGSDAASDVIPSRVQGVSHPVHLLMLHALGVHIFDNCDLEGLARTAARLKRWEFLLTASPIPVTGGTGSPLNPIATF